MGFNINADPFFFESKSKRREEVGMYFNLCCITSKIYIKNILSLPLNFEITFYTLDSYKESKTNGLSQK